MKDAPSLLYCTLNVRKKCVPLLRNICDAADARKKKRASKYKNNNNQVSSFGQQVGADHTGEQIDGKCKSQIESKEPNNILILVVIH